MLVELSRFRVKPGKSARVDEWLAMLNERMDKDIFPRLIGDDECPLLVLYSG